MSLAYTITRSSIILYSYITKVLAGASLEADIPGISVSMKTEHTLLPSKK